MRINYARVFLALGCVLALIGIGVLIGVNIGKKKHDVGEPVMVPVTESSTWYFPEDDVSAAIDANFWNYAQMAYMLVGEIPDVSFYKIPAGAPRNNYVRDRFYAEEEGGYIYYHDEAGNRLSTVVCDLSSHQEEVDYDQLAADGVSGVILRVGFRGYGTGAIVDDDMFETHYEGATKAGLKVGIYFYSQAVSADEAAEEADYVLNKLYGRKIELPVVYDTEQVYDEGARTEGMDPSVRTDCAVTFCDRVAQSGYTPMIYTNRNFFATDLDMSRLSGYKLWLAHYAERPNFPYMYSGWQYTDTGVAAGVAGNVDLNVWFE